MTLSLAHCMHVVTGARESLRETGDTREALRDSLRENFFPMFLTTLNTVIGFLAINTGEVPPLIDLGVIVTIGLTAVYLLSLSFLPAFMSLARMRQPAQAQANHGERYARTVRFVGRHHKPILIAWALLAVLSVFGVRQNTINDNFVEYFASDVKIRQDSELIVDRLTGIHQLHFSLDSGSDEGVFEPAYLARLDKFAQWLRAQPGVRHVTTVSDVIKRLNKEMNGGDAAAYVLPTSREQAAQYFLLYEMSLPYGLDATDRVDMTHAATRLTAVIDNLSSSEILALDNAAQAWLRKHGDASMRTVGTGPTIMFADIGQRNAYSMLKGSALGMALIVLTLMPALRSVRVGVLSLVPNLLPCLFAFAVWGVIDGEIGLAVSIVTVMTFGIIVDDTVHLLTRYSHARRAGASAEQAVAEAIAKVGGAVIGTSITLMAGFGVLAFSAFRLNSSLGILTATVVGIALLAEFFLLPALLVAFDRRGREPEAAADAIPALAPGT